MVILIDVIAIILVIILTISAVFAILNKISSQSTIADLKPPKKEEIIIKDDEKL